MFNEIKQLGKQTFIYGLGSVASSAINFILLPVYTRILTPKDYGVLDLLTSFNSILGIIISAGIGTALFKVYYKDCNTEEERKLTVSTALIFLMSVSFLFFFIIQFFANYLSILLLNDRQYSQIVFLASLSLMFDVLNTIPLSVYRAKEKPYHYIMISFSKLLLNILLCIYFIIIVKLGVLGVILSNLISALSVDVLFIPYMFKLYGCYFSKKHLYKLLYFGLPFIPGGICTWIIGNSNRYFINHFLNLSQTGIYAFGNKLGMIIGILLVNPFQIAWPPILFKLSNREDNKLLYSKIFQAYLLILILVGLAISLFSNSIVSIIASSAFHESYKLIPFIIISNIFLGLQTIIVTGLWLKNKVYITSNIILLVSAINILLNYILISKYGLVGAAVTSIISNGILFFLTYLFSNKYYPIQYFNYKSMYLIIIAVSVLVLNYVITPLPNIIYDIILRFIIFFTSLLILFYLRIINPFIIKTLLIDFKNNR
ncbi:MAG: Polysaccharide biosynthesis protein [Methanobacterium sp. PtaU1.Bin097]|nr:MAG: Polysaccharide biosynthesis protein [Methanobacterium sp. PtaU1.Bin097]